MRLDGFDYADHSAYFVTICTQDRLPLFGSIRDEMMLPNAAGIMLARWWAELPRKFRQVEIDEFVVMPNHAHGLLLINGPDVLIREPDARIGPDGDAGTTVQMPNVPLSRIMQWFKTMTTNAYFSGVRDDGWQRVPSKLWQRGYYDHIVRRDEALNDIRQYIIDNPWKWAEDEHNPRST